jgi:hypothetical protein
MPKTLVDEVIVRAELDFACEALEKIWGLSFPKPTLYLGDRHQSKFMEFHSMKDIERASSIQMMYDDTCNGIYIPDMLMDDNWFQWRGRSRPQRVFGLLHESVHAALAHGNQIFCDEHSHRLMKSKKKADEEELYVLLAFNEGFAHYLAMAVCAVSGDEGLREKGRREEKDLISYFEEWITNNQVLFDLYKCRKGDVSGFLRGYFSRTPGMLQLFKYPVGHRFATAVKPTPRTIGRYIANPPTTMRELIYPEQYLRDLARVATAR